jgi:hypothetical protein
MSRPDQPTRVAWKSPAVCDLSIVANSLERSCSSIPASATIAWITCATCWSTGEMATCISKLNVSTPASFSGAFALATSAFGGGTDLS